MRYVFKFVLLTSLLLSHSPQQVDADRFPEGTKVIPLPTNRPADPSEPLRPLNLNDNEKQNFSAESAILSLRARIDETEEFLHAGVTWRVFSDEIGEDGKLRLLGTFNGGDARFSLPVGFYLVHAAFGYAGQSKRIRVTSPATDNIFAIRAGGLRLNAAFREGDLVPTKHLRFEVANKKGNELKPITNDLSPGELIQLSEGFYEVTSHYGSVNSKATANVRVKSGKITELTLFQQAAEVTLKLVSTDGGEALANTSWTVLTPGGDPIADTIASSFPTLILAAGEYIAFASHAGKNFSKHFTIESGIHKEVEVTAQP